MVYLLRLWWKKYAGGYGEKRFCICRWIKSNDSFCNIRIIRIVTQGTQYMTSYWILLHKYHLFNWCLDGINQDCFYKEVWVLISRYINNKNNTFQILGQLGFWCKEQTESIFSQMLFSTCGIFDWDSFEGNQAGSYRGDWIRIPRFIITNSTFRNFRKTRFLMQGSESTISSTIVPIKV